MNSRLILLLALVTALGLGAAILLLQEEPTDSGSPSEVLQPARETRPPTVLPDPGQDLAPSTLPSLSETRTAEPIAEFQTSPTQIIGRVVYKGGTPVTAAEIVCFQADGTTAWMQYVPTPHTATTDEDGRFRMVGVPDGQTLSLEVSHVSSAPTSVEPLQLAQGQVLDVGEVVLEEGMRLFGKVLDPEGQPVIDAQLVVSDMGRPTTDSKAPVPILIASVRSDALGDYSVEHLGRRQYTVDITAEGFAPLQSAIAFMLNSTAGDFEQDYMLEEASSVLGGIVLGPEEQGVAGARISLMRRVPNNKAYYVMEQETDAQGRFQFDGIAEGRYDLRFSSPDWYLPLPRKLDAGDSEQIVRAQHAITVVGRVEAAGGLPDSISVTAKPDARTGAQLLGDGPRERTYKPGADGTFEFAGLRSGTYVLSVAAPGFAPTSSQDLVLGQDVLRVPVTVVLRPGGSIVGRVSDPSRVAVVELRDAEWDPLGPLDFAFPTQPVYGQRVKTGSSGEFRMKNVPAGSYVLSIKTTGMPDVHVRDVEVTDNGVVDVGLVKRETGGSIVGTVTGTRGEPLGGASISLSGSAARLRATTNLDGSFRLDAVPAGQYEVVAVPKAFFEAFRFEARQDVTVVSGEVFKVDLFLADRRPTPQQNQR